MADITPADWERAAPTRALLARIATHPGVAPEADGLRRPARVHRDLFLAFGPLKGTLENKFVIPGSDAQKATDVLKAKFGARNGAILQIVFNKPDGKLAAPAQRAAIDSALALAAKEQYATNVSGPFADNNQRLSKSHPGIGYAEVQFSKDGFQLIAQQDRQARGLDDGHARQGRHPDGVHGRRRPAAAGTGRERVARHPGRADRAADRLPHVRRRGRADPVRRPSRCGTAFGLLFLLANLTDFNTITPILVSMIGIGVGVDYTLFIVTRFRQALHDGMPPREAAAYASATAGRAVIFAGVTVAISITGLAVIGIPFITKLGMGGALGVLTAVLYATFLLPGLLALIGHRIDRLKVPFLRESDESEAARARTLHRALGRNDRASLGRPADRRDRAADHPGRAGARHASRHGRCEHGVQEHDRAPGLRPAHDGLRRRLQRADPDRRRPGLRHRRGAEGLPGRQAAAEVVRGLRAEADLQQEEGRRARRHLAGHQAAGQEDGRPDRHAAQAHGAGGARGYRRRMPT